jgi:polyisoprenyl-teichoic acid--peptidoglycan teichoic acid transferase
VLNRETLTILIAGLDRREEMPVGRADALVLARVDVVHATASLVSLPRDLLVHLPTGRTCKLAEVYFHGARLRRPHQPRVGLALLSRVIREELGVVVDHSVCVDFGGFARLVDGLGGLEVDVPSRIHVEDVEDKSEAAHFEPGPQVMDGAQALRYARTRMADGDTWRRRRHVQLAEAVLTGTRRRPLRALWALARARRSVVSTFGVGAVLALGQAAARSRRGSVRTSVLGPPLIRDARTPGGKSVQVAEPEALRLAVGRALVV